MCIRYAALCIAMRIYEDNKDCTGKLRKYEVNDGNVTNGLSAQGRRLAKI